jgi:hypothetical protein
MWRDIDVSEDHTASIFREKLFTMKMEAQAQNAYLVKDSYIT